MVVLEASFASSTFSSSLCLVQVRRRPWLCWRRPPPPHSAWCRGGGGHGCAGGVLLLLTLLGAGEEEAMVVLEASFSSSLCLVQVRRRPWRLCWRRAPSPPHSAWCR